MEAGGWAPRPRTDSSRAWAALGPLQGALQGPALSFLGHRVPRRDRTPLAPGPFWNFLFPGGGGRAVCALAGEKGSQPPDCQDVWGVSVLDAVFAGVLGPAVLATCFVPQCSL